MASRAATGWLQLLSKFSRKYRKRIRPGTARLSPVYSNVIRLGDGGIRTEAARFTALLSAVIASMWGSAGTELSLIWDGLTTDKPLLNENQILPAESETTALLRFTPSVF